jgi:hypothetical protein
MPLPRARMTPRRSRDQAAEASLAWRALPQRRAGNLRISVGGVRRSPSTATPKTRRLGPDVADTHNQRRRFRHVHHIAALCWAFLPLSPELLRNEDMQPACESQHKSQDVRADVVVEDLAEIRHHGMRDQFRVVVARGGGGACGACNQGSFIAFNNRSLPNQPNAASASTISRAAVSASAATTTRGFRHDFRQTFA